MTEKSSRGMEYGERLVNQLKDGSFKKFYLPNHGRVFTGGLEALTEKRFNAYLGSCCCAVIRKRTKNLECRYYG